MSVVVVLLWLMSQIAVAFFQSQPEGSACEQQKHSHTALLKPRVHVVKTFSYCPPEDSE